ncbi:MAG TPA: diacylglycerol kinase family protein [Cytophagaceae bacterium]|nr:diacylglycerol kinase family protein [Cytophagaceae bacterium]
MLFIINPISGGKKKDQFLSLLEKIPDRNRFLVELRKTEYAGHASVIAREALQDGVSRIIAVGGDGTVNEIAKELVGTQTSFGIIPFGSGNGLARHMHIPMNISKALELLNHASTKKIDVGYINNQAFFCTAGLAFDAHIGKVFAGMKSRGLLGYIRSVFKEYFSYTTEEYEVEIKGRKSRYRGFLVTVANAAQYGNNVYIAPDADISDGLLDLCIIKNFSIFRLFAMAYRVLNRSVNRSSYTTTLQAKSFIIRRKNKGAYHIDGEPHEGGKEFKFEIKESALTVLVHGITDVK